MGLGLLCVDQYLELQVEERMNIPVLPMPSGGILYQPLLHKPPFTYVRTYLGSALAARTGTEHSTRVQLLAQRSTICT